MIAQKAPYRTSRPRPGPWSLRWAPHKGRQTEVGPYSHRFILPRYQTENLQPGLTTQ